MIEGHSDDQQMDRQIQGHTTQTNWCIASQADRQPDEQSIRKMDKWTYIHCEKFTLYV